MKKWILLIGAAMIAYVVFSSFAAAGQREDQAALTDGGVHEVVYTVKEENDRVVVYRDDRLFLTTETPVSLLPKSDRSRLGEGIVLYSDEELKELIEDLCS